MYTIMINATKAMLDKTYSRLCRWIKDAEERWENDKAIINGYNLSQERTDRLIRESRIGYKNEIAEYRNEMARTINLARDTLSEEEIKYIDFTVYTL